MNGALELAPRSFPDRIAALGFTATLPVGWINHELPNEEIDFNDPRRMVPLALVSAPHAMIVFGFAARPAYDDGSLHDWARFLLEHNQLEPRAIGSETVAGVPALVGEATQPSDVGMLVVRFAFLEDGGRLLNLTLTAPEMFADGMRAAWFAMLQSFKLESPRGSRFASDGTVAASAPSAPAASSSPAGAAAAAPSAEPGAANEPTPFLTPDELIAIALADDTSSLDPELEFNANLRNRGVGFTPRIARVDAASKSVIVGAGAVEGFFRVPFGWHVIDDGKRALVFDAAGNIQVNLSLRRHEGASTTEYAEQLLVQYLEQQPDLPTIRHVLSGIAVSAVRGVRIGDETLDQYFLVRDIGRAAEGLYLVVKVSATAEHCSRAMDLAGDITATFETPRA